MSNDPRETKKREWFGLSYAEIEAIEKQIWDAEVNSHRTPYTFAHALARAIEERLKERNHDGK